MVIFAIFAGRFLVCKAFGTNKGKAGIANNENPINELWAIVKQGVPGMTADQYFGFDPVDKQGYNSTLAIFDE